MKVILYMAMTINGFIAKEDDGTPWSEIVWESYYKIAKNFKAIILGRKTYEIMKRENEFEKIGNPFVVVVTNQTKENKDNLVYVNSPNEAIKLLKEKQFTEILIAGGGKLNASFMKENLINEVILDVEPIIFGKGIKLFSEGDFEANLELIETKKLSENEIQLHYKVKN